jgi:hypothetical protein
LRTRTKRLLETVTIVAAAFALACCAVNGAGGDGLLCLLPALLFALMLLTRRYPGERMLIAAHAARRARWPRAHSSAHRRQRVVATIARGGLLLARSLAVRPPPRALALS